MPSTYELLDRAASGKLGFDHRLLHALIDDPETTVPDLLRWGLEDHEEQPFPLGDELVSIFRYLKTPEAIPFFIEYIRREPTDLPDDLFEAMYRVREATIEPLLKLYGELEEEDSGEVAFLLSGLGVRDPRILEILLGRLEYDAGDTAISLGLYGDPAAKPALEKLLTELTPEEDSHLRSDIEDAISQLGRTPDADEAQTYDIWDDFPEKAGPEFDVLGEADRIDYLTADDAEEREAAAASFINREYGILARDALLQCAQQDPGEAVRAKCWEALSEHSEEPQIREALLARLQDTNAPQVERAGALMGLANEADKPPVRALAEEFYHNPDTRAAALKAMWGSMDRSFAPHVSKHIDDADMDVRRQAIAGVGYLGIQDSSERLREYFKDEDLRPNALFAYALSMRAEISKGRVPGMLRRIDGFAEGLSPEEEELVKVALDERLLLNGHDPYFFPPEAEGEDEIEPVEPAPVKAGRNDPCPCGSGKKFKKCHGA